MTVVLEIGGLIGLMVARFCYDAAARSLGLGYTPQRAATEESVFVVGLSLVLPVASVIAGRLAGRRHAVLTPRLLATNAAVLALIGGSQPLWGSESLPLKIARTLFRMCLQALMAVLGWKFGAWTAAARWPNPRLQRSAGSGN